MEIPSMLVACPLGNGTCESSLVKIVSHLLFKVMDILKHQRQEYNGNTGNVSCKSIRICSLW